MSRPYDPRAKARVLWTAALLCLSPILSATPATGSVDVTERGVPNDGTTEATDAVQALLDAGETDLHFPAGRYLLGRVTVPADSRLRFGPRASVRLHAPGLDDEDEPPAVFLLAGDRITLEGIDFDFTGPDGEQLGRETVSALIQGTGVSDIRLERLRAVRDYPDPGTRTQSPIPLAERTRRNMLPRFHSRRVPSLIRLEDCRNVVLADSQARNMAHMIQTRHCTNVTVRGNRMEHGGTITTFHAGSESLRHHDNWSRDVQYQVVWRGGSPDPSRKAPRVPLGSSTVVERGSDPDDEDYSRHTAGTFDVLIHNNYAEYGMTLAWGNKGRQVVIDSNVARFISDYAYGTEGGENLVISNNISINSTAAGIVSMYWGEKLLITGNLVIVRDEPWEPALSWWPTQRRYQGNFVRLHHGPTTREDSAAGSRYGAGTVAITGNLFVNELTNRTRAVLIEQSRDVLVSGNKLTNGAIRKVEPGRVVAIGNEFVSRMPRPPRAVSVGRGASEAIVKDNVFKHQRNEAPETESDDGHPRLEFTDDTAEADDGETAQPAISVDPAAPHRATIEGNVIEGWPISVRAAATRTAEEMSRAEGTPSLFIVRNNIADGTMIVHGRDGSFRHHASGNLNSETLEEIEVEVE